MYFSEEGVGERRGGFFLSRATGRLVIILLGLGLAGTSAWAAGEYCPGTDPYYLPPTLKWIRERSVGPNGRTYRRPRLPAPRRSRFHFTYPVGRLQGHARRRPRSEPTRWAVAARLFRAAKRGDLVRAQRLLARYPRLVSARDDGGYTALLWAARKGHVSLVRLLLAKGAKVNVRNNWNNTPLHWAAYNGHLAVVSRLIKAGADLSAREREMGHTPLHDAAWKGQRRVIALLLRAGARTDIKNNRGQTPYQVAELHGHWAAARLIRSYQARANALDEAEPGRERPGALDLAKRGDLKGLKRLLARHPSRVNFRGPYGYTPLIWAARQGHPAVVKYLLGRGAKVNAVNRWRNTALHWAAYNGHVRVVALLIKRGARLNIQEIEKGHTPLHDAAWKGRRRVVALLLRAGARTDLKNGRGKTAWQVAERHGHLQVAALIRRFARTASGKVRRSRRRSRRPLLGSRGPLPRRRIWDLARRGDTTRLRALLAARPRLVSARDHAGRTPLHEAARRGRYGAVKVLLQAGADIKARNAAGLTPFQAAVRAHHRAVAKLIRSYGGR